MVKRVIKQTLFYVFLFSYASAFANSKENNENVIFYSIEETISVDQLLASKGMDFVELKRLNPQLLDVNQILMKGEVIKLTENLSMVNTNSHNEATLPGLGSSITDIGDESIVDDVLSFTGVNQYVKGTAEENVASTLNSALTHDWENFSAQEILDESEAKLKNTVKNEINSQANNVAKNILGRFGKAEVSLVIDEDGNLQGSQLNVLSPLYDEDENLFFSQVGFHEQDSNDYSRLIGNFGLGYRYETDKWLAGSNIFIDHDFTGENTRLGLGAEYWQDNFKLATNYYTPLSGWKESEAMKQHEALIYDERAARGFDIRTKTYLPNYPQIGGNLTFEQYFGDEVALFGIQNRQRDPYAFTLGVDYQPIPLIKAELAHKMGKNGLDDTSLKLNMNLQLGTAFEEQIDPENVALSRSLKGSRYDMVDRNYDIVFEYQQEDFSISINGPTQAVLGTNVAITSDIQSRAEIESYEWIVTDIAGNPIYVTSNTELPVLTFLITENIDHYIRLKVRTVRGYEAVSDRFRVNVVSTASNSLLTAQNDEDFPIHVIDFTQLNYTDYQTLFSRTQNERAELLFTAIDAEGNPYNLIDNPDLTIHFRNNGRNARDFQNYIDGESPIRIEWIDGEESHQRKFVVVADQSLIPDEGGNLELDIVISSVMNRQVFAQTTVSFINPRNDDLLIDPNNIKIQIIKDNFGVNEQSMYCNPGDCVSESGFEGGEPLKLQRAPTETGETYRVRILTLENRAKDFNNWIDVTENFIDSIVWLYWDPITKTEITAKNNPHILEVNNQNRSYRALEGCRGSVTYVTQENNYIFNELAWGDIQEVDQAKDRNKKTVTEQGLMLAVQFDFAAAHAAKDLSQRRCEIYSAVTDSEYLGFTESGEQKSILWSEIE